ncbi:hypothetical protein HDEF_2164 [Candidatus Hamiltonella defensa 5AT (Acyrthosiphon pisum)]|uniref:Uncharacterized protein n=1 Tax=Hamiltonella defensa subsp. Acyrthosiphon pisum (strain 5AT) TaxID=572265 RepID=C4K867_HAMD5|nr:hypothetical protein HDEF_2164 [Candidatus Hamiltonella defensa 5AT (Acyrthosiphon pisum)]
MRQNQQNQQNQLKKMLFFIKKQVNLGFYYNKHHLNNYDIQLLVV